MKIISKYKDYYDFLVGTYGIDENYIYDRTEFYNLPYIKSDKMVTNLIIGEYKFVGLWMGGKCYFGDSVAKFSDELNSDLFKRVYFSNRNITDKTHYFIKDGRFHIEIPKTPVFLGDSSPSFELDCPVLIETSHWETENVKKYRKNPILSQYNLVSGYSADDVYHKLNDWFSRRNTMKEKDVPVGDDSVRIVSAGFDLKTSFRKGKDGRGKK